MNLRKMLLGHLEEKQVKAFESRKKRGSRLADRRYTQLIDAIDALRTPKRKPRKKGRTS